MEKIILEPEEQDTHEINHETKAPIIILSAAGSFSTIIRMYIKHRVKTPH